MLAAFSPADVPEASAWLGLVRAPGLASSVALTLGSGLGATLLALGGAIVLVAASHGRRSRGLHLLLPPLLAVPHLASAVGFAFLAAPSGWLVRALSPWLTGWQRPPDLLTVNDPWGLALTLGLALRECPFLLLAILAAQGQIDVERPLAIARCAGYGPREAWLKLILPVLYGRLRLPLYAVLAFALSVVDMALVLGPSAPPVLAVRLLHWLQDPEPAWNRVGAAGALVQLGLIGAAVAVWRLAEAGARRLGRRWLVAGPSPRLERSIATVGAAASVLVYGLGVLGLVVLLLWSIAGEWRYPAALPQALTLASWDWVARDLVTPCRNTLLVGIAATLLALVAALACLEQESRAAARHASAIPALVYLPLLVPQITFLFGLQTAFVRIGLDATPTGLVWSHLVFVLPYVLLMLREPYLALDARYVATSRALGASPARTFWRVRLPLLRRPLLVAAALGFTVSVAQYLPTLFVGAGRFPTLTTETLGLALGGDRRLAAAATLLLAALPLLALAGALAAPSPRLGRDHRQGYRT